MAEARPTFPPDEAERLAGLLTKRIDVSSLKLKKLAPEDRQMLGAMLPGDELWEWAWFGTIGRRDAYQSGWCVIRSGVVVDGTCDSRG